MICLHELRVVGHMLNLAAAHLSLVVVRTRGSMRTGDGVTMLRRAPRAKCPLPESARDDVVAARVAGHEHDQSVGLQRHPHRGD